MNTLTVSIGLLVLATLVAVALHGIWQSYRNRTPRDPREAEADRTGSASFFAPTAANELNHSSNEPLAQADAAVVRADSIADPPAALVAVTSATTAAVVVPALRATSPDAQSRGEPRLDADATVQPDDSRSAYALPETGPDADAVLSPAGAVEPQLAASAAAPEMLTGDGTAAVLATQAEAGAGGAAGGLPGGPISQPNPAAASPSGTLDAHAGILSARTDCIVELALPSPLAGQRLLQTLQTIRRFGSKPVLFEGLLAPELRQVPSGEPGEPVLLIADDGQVSPADPQQDVWVPLRADVFYRSLRMGVLMANRHGALNPMEFAEFSETASKLADHLGALVMIPDMTRTLEAARALDVECIKLDAQLGLNVDCLSALSTAHLSRVARDLLLVERGSNRFVRLGRNDAVLFSVAQADRPNRVTLLLDVPRAPVDQQPWPALLQCAHDLMTAVQGHLVDDGGRPLNSRNLDSLSASLAQRYAMLDQSGLKAGSPLALRVFN